MESAEMKCLWCHLIRDNNQACKEILKVLKFLCELTLPLQYPQLSVL